MFSRREFARFLLGTDVSRYNNHWSPYYRHCTPCIANFSAVLKIDSDNYQEEQIFLLKQTGLSAPEIINKGPDGEKTSLDYFQTLRCQEIKKLANIYLFDLILFEYDVEHYYKQCLQWSHFPPPSSTNTTSSEEEPPDFSFSSFVAGGVGSELPFSLSDSDLYWLYSAMFNLPSLSKS